MNQEKNDEDEADEMNQEDYSKHDVKVIFSDFQRGARWWSSKGYKWWGASTAKRVKRDHPVQIGRLSGSKNFVGNGKFIFNTFKNVKPEWYDRIQGTNNSMSNRVLNLLETTYFRTVITVIKFGVNNGGGNGSRSVEIKIVRQQNSGN